MSKGKTAHQTLSAGVITAGAPTARRMQASVSPGEQAAALDRIGHVFKLSFQADPMERIGEIRRGVPAKRVGEISLAMNMPKDMLMLLLGLPRATVHRKAANDESLSPDESERVIGVQTLIGQVQAMVDESGDPEGFDAAKWVASWLDTPLPALHGEKPAEYLDTVEGQKLIGNILRMAQSGAYA